MDLSPEDALLYKRISELVYPTPLYSSVFDPEEIVNYKIQMYAERTVDHWPNSMNIHQENAVSNIVKSIPARVKEALIDQCRLDTLDSIL